MSAQNNYINMTTKLSKSAEFVFLKENLSGLINFFNIVILVGKKIYFCCVIYDGYSCHLPCYMNEQCFTSGHICKVTNEVHEVL